MSIVVVGNVFVDIKGFPEDKYIPAGRNAGNVEFFHGGVGRNVAEDIANIELRPTFVSMVDNTPQGEDVVKRLKRHKVNTDYVLSVPNGMGIWLAIFDNTGDLLSAISKRPIMDPMLRLLDEKGDEIFRDADSIVVEMDLDKEIVKKVFYYARKYGKRVYGVVANMSIALERRDFLQSVDCFVCNQQEAGILFLKDYDKMRPEELCEELAQRIQSAQIPAMVVTMGGKGSVYASLDGQKGFCPSQKVEIKDTTGAGDAFFSGVALSLTYGKSMHEAVQNGTRLAASVIQLNENVCPRFLPRELGIDIDVV